LDFLSGAVPIIIGLATLKVGLDGPFPTMFVVALFLFVFGVFSSSYRD